MLYSIELHYPKIDIVTAGKAYRDTSKPVLLSVILNKDSEHTVLLLQIELILYRLAVVIDRQIKFFIDVIIVNNADTVIDPALLIK